MGDNMRKDTIIFGIGKYGKEYVKRCVDSNVRNIRIIDSDEKLWGNTYMGIAIENPEVVLADEVELVVVAVSDIYEQEIFWQLTERYKIPMEKIKYYRETVVLGKDEVYNLGNMSFCERIEDGMILTGKELCDRLQKDSLNELERFFFEGKHHILDKWLHYFDAYERFFSKYKGKDVVILEIGVHKGGSLQMWKHYFKGKNNRVRVYGIDIVEECKLLEEESVEIFIGSQEDRDFLRSVKEKTGQVDIVIDDGGHYMNQQIVAFEELFDIVKEDGIYLCEDLHTSYMKQFGGAYRGETFVEYSKNLIDDLHAQYLEMEELGRNKYSSQIKAITYYDSMIFIEKKKVADKSIFIQTGDREIRRK